MRSPIQRMAPLLVILAVAPLASAATFTPAVTPPTPGISPATASPVTAAGSSPTFAPSPPPTALRRTPLPTTSPAPAAPVDPTPVAVPDVAEDAALIRDTPAAHALPTSAPDAPVRAFRTPAREEEPAFVAPRPEVPADADGTQPDEAGTEPMPPPDQPYIATITFQAAASTDVDGFELVVIYPRTAGDFVGNRNGVDCRKTGDATMFADDHEDGMLRVLVASTRALTFPLDIVCHFTVAPNATLTSRLIAVNVAEVTFGNQPVDASALSVSVNAR